MIRDPSDGSVREPKKPEAGIPVTEKPGPVIDPTTSGLPAAAARDADRHERSKEWLKQYRQKIADINRMNDKGEIPKEEPKS